MEVTERGAEICPYAVNRGRVGPLLRSVPVQLPFQNCDSLVLREFVLSSSNEGWNFHFQWQQRAKSGVTTITCVWPGERDGSLQNSESRKPGQSKRGWNKLGQPVDRPSGQPVGQ